MYGEHSQSIIIVIAEAIQSHWLKAGEATHRQISLHEELLVNIRLLLIDQNEHMIGIPF